MLGVVENMSYFMAPGGERVQLFPKGSIDSYLQEKGILKLGEIPFNPSVGLGGEAGIPVAQSAPDSSESAAFKSVAMKLRELLA